MNGCISTQLYARLHGVNKGAASLNSGAPADHQEIDMPTVADPDISTEVAALCRRCVRTESDLGAATMALQAAAIDVRFTAAIVTVQDRDVAPEIHRRLQRRLRKQLDTEIEFTAKRILAERARTELHERLCAILEVCRHCLTDLENGETAGVCSLCAGDDDPE